MLQELEPLLPVGRIDETLSFWRDELRFDVTGQSDGWARVARDRVAVMFFVGHVGEGFGGVLVVRAEDVDAFAANVDAAPHWGPRDTADRRREVAYRDPNGYVVNFTQSIGPEGTFD